MDLTEAAKQLALSYIEFQPRTRAEVERRLARAEFEPDVIASVLEDLERAGLVDDARFSQEWVESRARRKKFGRARLAMELRRKGVDRQQVEQAVSGMDEAAEVAAALELAAKRWSADSAEADPAERGAARRRLAAYLQRRGYKWDIIEQVFARLFAKEE